MSCMAAAFNKKRNNTTFLNVLCPTAMSKILFSLLYNLMKVNNKKTFVCYQRQRMYFFYQETEDFYCFFSFCTFSKSFDSREWSFMKSSYLLFFLLSQYFNQNEFNLFNKGNNKKSFVLFFSYFLSFHSFPSLFALKLALS